MVKGEYDKQGTYSSILTKHTKPTMIEEYSNFDYNLYDKGTEWFKSGLSLDDAPDELKYSKDFIAGFERGKRLEFVRQLKTQKGPIKK